MKNRQIVYSSSYGTTNRPDVLFEAWLGTCVGVSLHDPIAKIGGMIHLLLDRPTDISDIPYKPETYAQTGLPLLMRDLLQSGAAHDRLVADIAGGALLAPFSNQDINLDIGGRTFEAAMEFLKTNKITIRKVEAGGFFATRMVLDSQDWNCLIEPLIPSQQAATSTPEIQVVNKRAILDTIAHIRPIPQIALKIMRMIREEEYDMSDISQEVKQDQVISGLALAYANSAIIGARKSIDSIDRALTLLGEKKFLTLILSAAFEPLFPQQQYGYSYCKGGIFKHAIGTAQVASFLANRFRIADDVAYTAGLLHDIGKIVLDQHISSGAPYFYRCVNEAGKDLILVEQERFGFDHTHLGGILAEKWQLAADLTEVIKLHHDPQRATVDQPLTALIYLADLLMSRFGVGLDLEHLRTDEFEVNLDILGIRADQIQSLVAAIPHEIFAIENETKIA